LGLDYHRIAIALVCDHISVDKWQAGFGGLLVLHILLTEKVEQRDLLRVNAFLKEKPARDEI
jgi:hypothetical protein